MSGKHDRSLDDEQSAKLLLTGPIVIRGLSRSVKDALHPGRPSRHRAFATDTDEAVEPTPVQAMLTSGPAVPESGPSSPVADAPTTQTVVHADTASLWRPAPPQTETPGGSGENSVNERPDAVHDDDAADGSAGEVESCVRLESTVTSDGEPLGVSAAHDSDATVEQVAIALDGDVAATTAEQDDRMNIGAVLVEDAADPVSHGRESGGQEPTYLDDEAVESAPAGSVGSAEPDGADAVIEFSDARDRFSTLEEGSSSDNAAERRDAEQAALDGAAADLLSPDVARGDIGVGAEVPAPPAGIQDPVVARFAADRGWTTAEELFSRPITLPTSPTTEKEGPDGSKPADGPSDFAAVQDDGPTPEKSPSEMDAATGVETEQGLDPFDDAFLAPDEPDRSGGPVPAEAAIPFAAAPEAEPVESVGAENFESAYELEADVVIEPGPAAPQVGTDEAHEEAASQVVAKTSDESIEPHEAVEWASADELAAESVTEAGPDVPLLDNARDPEVKAALVPLDAAEDADADRSATEAFFADFGEPEAAVEPESAAEPKVIAEPGLTTEPESAAPAAHDASDRAENAAPAAMGVPPRATGPATPLARPAAAGSCRPGGSDRPTHTTRPVRERFGREAVAIVVLVVLALVCGGLITAVILRTQRDAALAASEAASYTPPPLATPTPAATGPSMAVIGDGTTSAAGSGVTSSQRWSALLGSSLAGPVSTDASIGMGYAAKGSSGETFVQAAADVPSNAEVVIVFGGAADVDVQTLSLAKAATDTYSAVQKRAPDAKLIVVGPVISGGANDADLTAIRNTLRSAAAIAKATWVDPIDAGWLSASKQSASSPRALTTSDEKTIASKMQAVVKKALR